MMPAVTCKPQANKKFFDPTIFQKCWRGAGEQPTFAKQICLRAGFQSRAAGKQKFFDPTIFQKCWRGSGRVAHICEANLSESWLSITSRRQTKVF